MAYTQHFGLSRNSPLNMGGDNTSKEIEPKIDTSPKEASSIISQNNSRKGPKHMLSQGTEDDSFFTKVKTAFMNPLDTFKVAGGFGQDKFKGEGDTYRSMTSLREAKDAQEKGVKIPDLEKSNAMNNALSLAPPIMAAQTLTDAASGDLMGAFAGKFTKKFKTVKKPLQSLVKNAYAGIKYKNALGKTI